MKQTILKYFLFGMTLLSGFFSWFVLYHSPDYSGIHAWLFPAISFSVYVIILSLMAILIRQEIAFEFVVIFSLLPSLIFVFSIWHCLVMLVGIILMLMAVREIRKDLDMNIKVDFWKSLYMGRFRMIIALALIISSQYFCMINASSGDKEKFIPEFDISPITKKIIEPVLIIINPNFKTIQKESFTVDQFIIKSKQDDNEKLSGYDLNSEIESQIPSNLPAEQREKLKQVALQEINEYKSTLSQKNQELALQEGREQLAQMVGHKISGDEKISDVFAGFIDKKINDYFQPHKIGDEEKAYMFAYIIAIILFFTIWPLGVALSVVWFVIIIVIFKILVHFGLVEIKTVTVQREMIV